MRKVAVVTDSNSGISQQEAKELGIWVLPMPFFINEEEFFEELTLSREEFYRYQDQDANIKTSQPAPADVIALWEEVLEEYDELVHIPMSSGLSGSCQAAIMLAEEFDKKVQVVNNQRISITQKCSVLDAIALVKKGYSAAEIKDILEAHKLESSIYVTVDTLKHLKKGGRITPAAAAIGTVLNLKPVLQIQGDKLDAYAKVRGWKQAKKAMLDAMEKDLNTRFQGKKLRLDAAYTTSLEDAQKWVEEIKVRFPDAELELAPLSLSVTCHLGQGALAITCCCIPEEIEN